ncbi:MAG TPA: regulatory protein RecX [Candidatus Acidoferrales bacterium]|nr:regulatory protein RecX [Candidatus Acidoferrales bacterium]
MSPWPRRRRTPAEARERRASVRDLDPVMNAAARFLEARPRSVAETRRRLAEAGYPAPLVDEVLLRLADLGYLDDESFARAWVESRDRAHPRGEAALRRELTLKGIRADVIAAVLEERRAPPGPDRPGASPRGASGPSDPAAGPDLDAALLLLRRRAPALAREPDLRARRRKAYALLGRQGFDPGTCREALEAWWLAAGGQTAADAAQEAPESPSGIDDV